MIYFVRHGQTNDNAKGNLLSGWNNISLNCKGKKNKQNKQLFC